MSDKEITGEQNLTNRTAQPMRIMWLSNAPYVKTGYGCQTGLFVPRIHQAGYPMAITAYYGLQGGILNMGDIPIYPQFYHPYGQDVMSAHTNHFKADALITLTDTWVIEMQYLYGDFKWIPWYPVDHVTMPANVRRNIGQAYARIAMSKFGRDMTNESGLDCYYIPHGVDTSVIKPVDKAEARKLLNLPQDKYIMGMVAMNKGNPSRKSFVEILSAFAMFKKVHPDSVFYLHTHKCEHGEAGGINIPELLLILGLQLGKDVLMPDQYLYMLGYDDTFMANMYSSLDVHVLVSKGEGFGIPILEAQACGTPVIVGDWTAMSELCFSGQKVSMKDADPEYTGIAAYQMKPRVRAIELAMHAEYNKPSPRKLAREKALEYDVNVITEKYWLPTLKELQEKIYAEREQMTHETELAQAKAGVA